jgi:DNA-binding LacI/PurR family transcriptional regulator
MQVLLRDWRVDELRRAGRPFVMIGRTADNTGLSYVDFDFERAVEMIFDILVGLGHRNIAFIGRPEAQLAAGLAAAVRLHAGFRAAIAKHNLEPRLLQVDLDGRLVAQNVLALLERDPTITGFVTPHGISTAGVLAALRSAGRSIPEEFSVVGLAPHRVVELAAPWLTYVEQPSSELGYRAAAMLIGQLSGSAFDGHLPEVSQIVLPPALTLGTSTAKPSL